MNECEECGCEHNGDSEHERRLRLYGPDDPKDAEIARLRSENEAVRRELEMLRARYHHAINDPQRERAVKAEAELELQLTRANLYEAERADLLAKLTEAEKIKHDNQVYCPCAHGFFKRAEAAEAKLASAQALLIDIRDKWVPALLRDAREADKTDCNAHSILACIVRLYPSTADRALGEK